MSLTLLFHHLLLNMFRMLVHPSSGMDGCTNIRNMLSSKWWNNNASDIKLVCVYSTIKMMYGPINLKYYAIYAYFVCFFKNF